MKQELLRGYGISFGPTAFDILAQTRLAKQNGEAQQLFLGPGIL